MTDQTNRTIKSTAIVFSFLIISALFAYLFRLLLARNLSLEDFGLFFSLTAFASLLLILRDIGLSQVAVYYIPRLIAKGKKGELKHHVKKIFATEILLTFIIMILFFALSGFLSKHYFHYDNSTAIAIFGIAFFLNSIELNLQLMFQSFQRYILYSVQNLLRNALVFIVAYFAFDISKSIFTPIYSYIAVFLALLFVFSFFFFKKTFPDFTSIKEKEFSYKKYYLFGLFGSLAMLGHVLLNSIDTFLLTYFNTLENVGIYNAAVPLITLMLYLPTAIGIIILPLSAELWSKKKYVELKSLIESISKYIAIYLCAFAGILIAFPTEIISILFGSSFEKSSTSLVILAIGAVFFGLATVFMNFILGIHGPKKNLKTYLISIASTVVFAFILIPKYNITGAAIATTLGYFTSFIISLIQSNEFINLKKILKNTVTIIICSAAIPFTINYLNKIHAFNIKWAIISILLATCIYIILLFILRTIEFNELKKLLKIAFKK